MPSRRTTSQAHWIHHRPSASTRLGNLCSLTRDCLTSRCQSGGFGRGSSGSSNRSRFREIKFRDEDAFDIKAGWGKAEARTRRPLQSPLGALVSVGGVPTAHLPTRNGKALHADVEDSRGASGVVGTRSPRGVTEARDGVSDAVQYPAAAALRSYRSGSVVSTEPSLSCYFQIAVLGGQHATIHPDLRRYGTTPT